MNEPNEVPEPSTECPKCGVRATGQTPSTFYTHHDETCGGALEEPQGEPSDAQIEPTDNERDMSLDWEKVRGVLVYYLDGYAIESIRRDLGLR